MVRSVFFAMCVVTLSMCAAPTRAQTYINLLQGDSLDAWTKPDGSPVDSGWVLEPAGVLHLAGKGGNLISKELFGDFDLWFDYRVAAKGNNGIKYRVQPYGKSLLGLEYQIQDDQAFPGMADKHKTATLYDLFVPSQPIFRQEYRPLDQFNAGRIVVQNQRIRHWMNGRLIIDECSGSDRWQQAVEHSKFKQHAGFGQNRTGHLMLTDHNSEAWFRNVYIRRLDGCPEI